MMWVIGAAAVVLLVVAAHMLVLAPRVLTVSHVELPIADLPPEFDGYTIGVLSDLHRWPWTPLRHFRRALAAAVAAQPDAVVLLGDYGLSWKSTAPWANRPLYRAAMRELTPLLRSLRPRDGAFAVLGNHDHYFSAEEVTAWLRAAGVRPLVNDCAVIQRGSARLLIGGVDDLLEGSVDPAGGCGCDSPDTPAIVLAHHPDSVLHLTAPRRVDLVLSGHTHGGQYVLPVYGAPVTLSQVCGPMTASGWVPNPRSPLYVSRGIGEQMPGRLNCPPEVVIVQLSALGARPSAGAV